MARKLKLNRTTELELPESGEAPKRTLIQLASFRAMQIYLSMPGSSIDYVVNNFRLDPDDPSSPLLSSIGSLVSFRRIAKNGKWEERRAEMWAKAEAEAHRRLGQAIVEQRVRELNVFQTVAQTALNYVFGVPDPDRPGEMLVNPVKPKSLEGVITALTRLDRAMEDKREAIEESASKVRPTVIDAGEVSAEFDDAIDDSELELFVDTMVKNRARKSSEALRKARNRGSGEE